jgi:hypothetical protein
MFAHEINGFLHVPNSKIVKLHGVDKKIALCVNAKNHNLNSNVGHAEFDFCFWCAQQSISVCVNTLAFRGCYSEKTTKEVFGL